MAYEPKEWVCGETITADALNHIEQGLADCCGGGTDHPILIVTIANYQATPSFSEIQDAYNAGKLIVLKTQVVPYEGAPPREIYRLANADVDPNSGSVMSFESSSILGFGSIDGEITSISSVVIRVSPYGCAIDIHNKTF